MSWKKILAASTVILVALLASGYAYVKQPQFGALTEPAKLNHSTHYVAGQFRNLEPDPVLNIPEDQRKGWVDFLLAADDNRTPNTALPVDVPDLHALDRNQDLVVWLGHSSFFIQLAGKRLLIDPVLSANASPIPMTNQAFAGTLPLTVEDIPTIDYLLISHDHWDHLDYPTLMAMQDRIDEAVAGLGVGAHLRAWGFDAKRIHEADWNTMLDSKDGLRIHVLPARHYSGRLLDKNQSLWVSFALESAERSIYFSGDSGYGRHFKEIGKRFGGFDLALLDSGQYNEQWRHIHMTPEDAAQAADDLGAKAMMPAHVGKFTLAFHRWDEPFERLVSASKGKSWQLLTPRIGQMLELTDEQQMATSHWWETAQGFR